MKKILAIVFMSMWGYGAMAQLEVDENSSFRDRIFTGGGLALSFGSNFTVVGASPLIGYMITDRWSAGIGATYLYRKFGGVNSNIYGGRAFTQYSIYNPFFAYSEFEVVSFDPTLDAENNRELVPAWYVGAGVSQPLGRAASFQLLVVYDLLYDDNRSPQPNAFGSEGWNRHRVLVIRQFTLDYNLIM